MKKFLLALIVSTSFLLVSCHWFHEKFNSVEECGKWYMEELYEAAVDGDVQKFRERAQQLDKWESNLSTSELEKLTEAGAEYAAEYPRKFITVLEFADKHSISLE